MFTFRRFTVLFFILVMALNLIHFVGCRQGWIYGHLCSHTYIYLVILVGFYLSLSVAMAFVIRSGFHSPVVCRATTEEKTCSITFDDGPDTELTPAILDVLERHRIQATFFVVGNRIKGRESMLERMDRDGHLIGNHSWSHSNWFDFFPSRKMKQELVRTAEAIEAAVGKSPVLFRPPYGVVNPMLTKALKGLNYHVIGWNIRTYDTVRREPAKIERRIQRRLTPGSIILLHDQAAGVPGLLERIIHLLHSNGYRIIPLTELIQTNSYA